MRYLIMLEPTEAGFAVQVPDLAISTQGRTIEEAKRAALKAIKAAGGVTFAQSDAAYDSMPRSAVETGHVDYLMPAVEIAKALSALAQEPLQGAKKPDSAGPAA